MPRRFSGAEVEGITSTHTVPKHTGPSGHSFIPWVGTPHVCTPHTVPLTIVDFHGHTHPISTITHLPFDCHRLCASPSYFGPLPAQFHPSQQLPSIDIPHHC